MCIRDRHEGHHHEPLKADDLTIEIGGDGVHPEFNDALRGMKVGEEKTFTVAYPETGAPGMAGHTIEYTANLEPELRLGALTLRHDKAGVVRAKRRTSASIFFPPNRQSAAGFT